MNPQASDDGSVVSLDQSARSEGSTHGGWVAYVRSVLPQWSVNLGRTIGHTATGLWTGIWKCESTSQPSAMPTISTSASALKPCDCQPGGPSGVEVSKTEGVLGAVSSLEGSRSMSGVESSHNREQLLGHYLFMYKSLTDKPLSDPDPCRAELQERLRNEIMKLTFDFRP